MNDRLVYLVGGTSSAKELFDLDVGDEPESSSLTLVGLNCPDNLIYQKNPKTIKHRNQPACAFHRDSMSLYIIGGIVQGHWSQDAYKYDMTNAKYSESFAQL